MKVIVEKPQNTKMDFTVDIGLTVSDIHHRIQNTDQISKKFIMEFKKLNDYLKNLIPNKIEPIFYRINNEGEFEVKKFDYIFSQTNHEVIQYVVVAFTEAGFWFLKWRLSDILLPEPDHYNHREFGELPKKTQIAIILELPRIIDYIHFVIKKRKALSNDVLLKINDLALTILEDKD